MRSPAPKLLVRVIDKLFVEHVIMGRDKGQFSVVAFERPVVIRCGLITRAFACDAISIGYAP